MHVVSHGAPSSLDELVAVPGERELHGVRGLYRRMSAVAVTRLIAPGKYAAPL